MNNIVVTTEMIDSVTTFGDSEDLVCFEELSTIVALLNRCDSVVEASLAFSQRTLRYFKCILLCSENRVIVSQKGSSIILIDTKLK